MQEDRRLLARVDAEVKKYKTPVNVVHLKNEHHALDLWENICQTGADLTTQPPILLLPEGYVLIEDWKAKLLEMSRLYKANELVSPQAEKGSIHSDQSFSNYSGLRYISQLAYLVSIICVQTSLNFASKLQSYSACMRLFKARQA